ncbi:MAG: hypothetical protein LBQ18_02155 [Campylobacteraceae bacterium]|nr:hypothetical protein [Campylobacteraceae bacterium]
MKRILIFLCLSGLLFAGKFEDNLKESVKNKFGLDITIVSSDSLKSIKGLRFAFIKTSDGNTMLWCASEDGKSFIAECNPVSFAKDSDEKLFMKRANEVRVMDEAPINQAIDDLLSSIPEEAGLLLKSKTKTDKLLTIVTDPDCPFCRNELANLREHLKTINVRLIFASVHDEKAFIKSALILKEAKGLQDNEKIISIVEKYYKDIELNEKQLQTNTDVVHAATKTIFDSRLIRGVPKLHYGKLR